MPEAILPFPQRSIIREVADAIAQEVSGLANTLRKRKSARRGGSKTGDYLTVSASVVECVMAVIPLLDWPVTEML